GDEPRRRGRGLGRRAGRGGPLAPGRPGGSVGLAARGFSPLPPAAGSGYARLQWQRTACPLPSQRRPAPALATRTRVHDSRACLATPRSVAGLTVMPFTHGGQTRADPPGEMIMTQDKAKKTATRQRMAETGEPYSVARHAVENEAAGAPSAADAGSIPAEAGGVPAKAGRGPGGAAPTRPGPAGGRPRAGSRRTRQRGSRPRRGTSLPGGRLRQRSRGRRGGRWRVAAAAGPAGVLPPRTLGRAAGRAGS